MLDIRKRFNMALEDTVKEWKKRENVRGMFVYGSYVKGTVTANSDLDICIVWDGQEAPTPLLAEHKGVRVDMTFLTSADIKNVLEDNIDDDTRIAEVISRLKSAEVVHDKDGTVKEWREKATKYQWPERIINMVKERANKALEGATQYAEQNDPIAAIYEVRRALFELGRTIQMRHNMFTIIRPAEILTEIRLLDPITYQLFLRAFKLKGMGEEELLQKLGEIELWLRTAEERFGQGKAHETAMGLLNQAQRDYHGAIGLTYNSDYELAVLEMRHAIDLLGFTLLALGGEPNTDPHTFIPELRAKEPEFFDRILVEFGAFEYQQKSVIRSIGETRFIADRL
jgi:predicted nucleotidyltransferase